MTRRIPVAKVGDMAPGQMRWVAAGMERLLLANVDGAFFSLSDECAATSGTASPEASWRATRWSVPCTSPASTYAPASWS